MNRFTDLPNWMTALAAQPRAAVLVALVVVAAAGDMRTHRIPNVLTLGGTLAGLLLAAIGAGRGATFVAALEGAALGLALMLPLWLARVTGAGDAKLVAMVGAFLGLPDLLFTLVFIVAAGGLWAIGFAIRHRRLRRLASNTRDIAQVAAIAALNGQAPALSGLDSIGKLPYGVCVCAGTLAWLAWSQVRG